MRNLKLNYEGFEDYLIEAHRADIENDLGVQYMFRFENNYGASVIKLQGSHGYENDLWELAVVKYTDEKTGYFGEYGYDIVYPRKITKNSKAEVQGFLSDKEVKNLLGEIKGL